MQSYRLPATQCRNHNPLRLSAVLTVAVGASACSFEPLDPPVKELFHDALNESSGVAMSPARDGVWFTHNDSGGEPELFSFSLAEDWVERHPVLGAKASDWEDIAAGPCPDRDNPCLYVADFGDNAERRDSVQIYAVSVPSSSEVAEVLAEWRVTYPMGPRNAEALLVHPFTGEMTIVTKAGDGISEVLRVPAETPYVEAISIATLLIEGEDKGDRLITGGDWSPDGAKLVLRSYTTAFEWQIDRTSHDAHWAKAPTIISLPKEKQGEAIAYLPDGRLLTTSEGQPMALQVTAAP